MSQKSGKTVSFYVSQDNAARVEYAKNAGINVSAIADDLFNKHLKPALEKAKAEKAKELRQLLDAPVP